jgi:hypothetical protein
LLRRFAPRNDGWRSAAAALPRAAERTALIAGEAAIAVDVGAVERLQAKLGRLGKRDAAVIIGIDPVEAAFTQPSEEAAALAAALDLLGAALAPALRAGGATFTAHAALLRGKEFGAADLAVAIRVEAREALLAAVLPGLAAFAPNGASESLRFGLGDIAVAVGVDARELGADAALHVGARDARPPIEAAAGLLGANGGSDQSGSGRTQEDKVLHQ